MRGVRGFALLLALLVAAPRLLAQAVDPTALANVDAYIEAEMKRQRIPGLSLAVMKDGKPVLLKGYGLANLELNVPVTADTVFKIASVSKQFVASAAMLLAQEGKISVEDEVGKFFPAAPETWKGIK